jgi:hypothetical protein
MSDLETIKAMLSFRRPAGSKTEAEYIARFLEPLGVQTDQFGNRFLTVGEDKPTVLWSSHTDSVHSKTGYQRIEVKGDVIRLPKKSRSNCLGADDAAGNWIMMEMIKAKVPGLYVFHFAEEIGCKGSGGIANQTPEFLAGIQSAIAFDRRGFGSVITHQRGRTASDNFARSVAAQLPKRFKPDPTGVLTDTKIYMGIVPECTNLSVGYEREHSSSETLDTGHLFELRDYMVKIDPSKFLIERDPKAKPKLTWASGASSLSRLAPKSIEDLVWSYPVQVAAFLDEQGVTFDELHKEIQDRKRSRISDLSSLFDDEDQDLLRA